MTIGIFIWHRFIINKNKLPLISVLNLILASLLLSYYSLATAVVDNFYPLTRQSLILPFYNNILLTLVPIENGLFALETMDNFCYVQPPQPQQPLKYPLHPLVFQTNKQPFNIVIIVIDTWRFDMLNHDVTPNLFHFAQSAWQFTQHSSGGNCTQPGIFSLFYALPASYWTAMTDQQQPPVLMDELKQQNYQFGIFASAPLYMPPFNKNIFYGIDQLKLMTAGATPFARDRFITQEFQQFINTKNQQPFFSFLFYDSAHSYCDDGNDIHTFQPEAPVCNRILLNNRSDPRIYFNRYKNALFFVDNLIADDLKILAQHDLLKNTVIIITGDHGNEFNDNHNNYWEHASNYSRYQIQTPLIIYWPQQKPKTITYITNHYQIVPTLMENVLGCKNPSHDYSIERSLLHPQSMPFLLAASYFNYGIIEHDRLTTLFPTGNYTIYNLQAQPLPTAKLRPNIISAAFNEMREYYKIRGL